MEGLSVSLENASVEKSKQRELLNKMNKELKETKNFIQVNCLQLHVYIVYIIVPLLIKR